MSCDRKSRARRAGRQQPEDRKLSWLSQRASPEMISRAARFRRQKDSAWKFLSAQEANQVGVKDAYRIVKLSDGTEISCHAVLIATGASFHTLKMPGADALTGAGIYYGAAYTEAMNYKDKDVFVVGGANSAAQGAIYLSQFARKVTVLIRGHRTHCFEISCGCDERKQEN